MKVKNTIVIIQLANLQEMYLLHKLLKKKGLLFEMLVKYVLVIKTVEFLPDFQKMCRFAHIFVRMSFSEIFFILFIVLILFGADKIPEIARGLGKGMRQLRDATNEIKTEIRKSAEQNNIDTSFIDETQKEIDKVKEEIEEATNVTGTVKRQR